MGQQVERHGGNSRLRVLETQMSHFERHIESRQNIF
jgi:hypothetical protein